MEGGPSPLCSEHSNIGSALTGNASLLDLHKLIFHLYVNPNKMPLPLARFISPHWSSAPRCPCAVNSLLSSKWHLWQTDTIACCWSEIGFLECPPTCLIPPLWPTLNEAPADQTWKSRTTWMHSEHWDDLFWDAWLLCKHHPLNKKQQPVDNSWSQCLSSPGLLSQKVWVSSEGCSQFCLENAWVPSCESHLLGGQWLGH